MTHIGIDGPTTALYPAMAERQILRKLPVVQFDLVEGRQKGAELRSEGQALKAAAIQDRGAVLQHAGNALPGDQQDHRAAAFHFAKAWMAGMGFLGGSDEAAGLGIGLAEGLCREALQLLEIDGSLRVHHYHVFLEGHHLADQLVRKAHVGIEKEQMAAIGFVLEKLDSR